MYFKQSKEFPQFQICPRRRLGFIFPKFNFPVGANALTYNLLQIGNAGTPDDFGVRCLPDALQGGATGMPFGSDAVAASWEVTEATPGGSALALKASWFLGDELPGFLRQNCALRQHNGATWLPAPLGV